ncbi:hypothetical protein [Algoriphagus antarcticus]|uniref:Uncharacterized protein n=1 Tax=Algoriphagus antarcticus TaxID=238540 RepID=A0A3E0DQP9_9BACT|nr:hypothetical protein [Algoriphagus antarcticus]REG85324.1 hypothetical protein C8N25_11311 [Algoriphagus antarcticus]
MIENFDGSLVLDVEGISELVKGMRFNFDSHLESDIQIIDPANTTLVADKFMDTEGQNSFEKHIFEIVTSTEIKYTSRTRRLSTSSAIS